MRKGTTEFILRLSYFGRKSSFCLDVNGLVCVDRKGEAEASPVHSDSWLEGEEYAAGSAGLVEACRLSEAAGNREDRTRSSELPAQIDRGEARFEVLEAGHVQHLSLQAPVAADIELQSTLDIHRESRRAGHVLGK